MARANVFIASLLAGVFAASLQAAEPESIRDNIWLLKDSDLTDAQAFVLKLSENSDPFSTCLRDYCSQAGEDFFADYDGTTPPNAELRKVLLEDLNRVIEYSDLYREKMFEEAEISGTAQALISQNPRGYERMRLNRMLLEEIFSNEIAGRPERLWLLRPADLVKLPAFTTKLREAKDPVSRYLRDHCTETVKRQIHEYNAKAPPSADFRENLVNSLNIVLQSDEFYEKERFLSVKLSSRSKTLIDRKATGMENVKLNRYLVEDAYPDYITGIEAVPIDIKADSLEFDNASNLMTGSGHVRLQKGDEMLRSDNAIVNLDSYDVLAEGNVQFERGSDVWIGKKLRYNFRSKQGDFGVFSAYMEPFYVHAESSKRISDDEYLLNNAVLSTCEGEHPRAFFRAQTVRIVPGHHVRAKHVVLYVGGVPVMYAPYWNQNIGDPNFISMVPGYNSRMWAFLLTTFNYRISRHIEAKSHLDVRARRGLAIGQDILWSSSGNAKGLSTEKYSGDIDDGPWVFGMRSAKRWEKAEDEEEDKWSGDLITYYGYDLWPDEGKSHDYPIPADRYRMRLTHNQTIDERDYFMAQLNYLSDPYIIEQFFREEYKTDPEPDNYVVLGRRGKYYSASLLFRKRFNDFYTSVDRLPEATLDFTRQQMWESPFYYEGKHTAGYLSKEWEKNLVSTSTSNNYSAFRFDTPNTIYYPTKQFGFLNIIPRAGWRGTVYSTGCNTYTNLAATSSVDTNGVTTTTVTTNIFTRSNNEAQLRSIPQIGLETSFKAFKVWETYPGETINNIRHIAEPYADYSLAAKPNVATNELYQFDEVDTLDKANEIQIGMRNKIQTQRFNKLEPSSRRYAVTDLINADIWTTYRVAPEPDQNVFSNIVYDIRSAPVDGVELYLDGEYNQYESQFHTFNTRLSLFDKTLWHYMLEYRYLEASNSLVNNELTLSPLPNWSYSVYVRYDFYDKHLEAYGLTIQKTMDCIVTKIGFEQQADDDFTVWLQFWFTQFPKIRADVGL